MDLLDKFLQFEEDNALFLRKYANNNYWHMIRYEVFREIELAKEPIFPGVLNTEYKSDKLKKIIVLIKGCIKSIGVKCRKAEIIACDLNITYRIINEKPMDVFIDPLRNDFDILSVATDIVDYNQGFKKRGLSYASSMLRGYWNLFIFSILKIKWDVDEENFLNEIYIKIRKEFDVEIENIAHLARKTIIFSNTYMPYTKKLLKKVAPSAVIITCHFTPAHFSLIKEAKNMGIPVIEIQSGLNINNVQYYIKDIKKNDEIFPDYILTFGEYFSNICRLPDRVKIIATGYAHIYFAKQKYKDMQRKDKTIIFYSNFNNALVDVMLDFSKSDCIDQYEIICKLHPREINCWKEYYPKLADSGIRIIDYKMDTYELLYKYKHHIGGSSSTMFEAIATGGHVYIHESGRAYLCDMLTAGFAVVFNTAQELISEITKKENIPNEENDRFNDWLYKSDAINNQVKAIHEIIKNHC